MNNELKISDYLKYYIGQKVLINNKRLENVIDKITSLNEFNECGGHEYEWDGKDCQLYLRQLESMTEKEAIELYRITDIRCPLNDPDYYDVTYLKNNEGKLYAIQVVDLRDVGVYMNIAADTGDILKYVQDGVSEPKIEARLRNQHKSTHYLLSLGFDLFGLIPSGLALSSNSIDNQEKKSI